jgi:hypothetical protein
MRSFCSQRVTHLHGTGTRYGTSLNFVYNNFQFKVSGQNLASLELRHTFRLLFLQTKNNPLIWNKVKRTNKST